MTGAASDLDANDSELLAQAFHHWASGQQQPAIETVRPPAEQGKRWALALITWFLHQTGEPGWRTAIPYAERAINAGYPMAANYVIGNMMNDPALRAQAAEMLGSAMAQGYQADPIGWAQQAAQQGDPTSAARLLDRSFGAYPLTHDGWKELVERARRASDQIADYESATAESSARVQSLAANVETAAAGATTRIETQTGQLFNLIQAATNRQAEAIFEDEASELRKEEQLLWRNGIVIVSAAAFISVLPLALHYLGLGPRFSSSNVLAAHFTSAASFAVVAGVMLARARGRDRARQRARDLTLALSTMFAYGAQIQDPAERSRFTYEMGRVVIESFLRADASSGSDESTSLLTALLQRS